MNGVILFVDDKVNEYSANGKEITRSLENELYEELRVDHPVLAVKSLELAQEVVKSVGSFTAIILDWRFDNRSALLEEGENDADILGIQAPPNGAATLDFLTNNDFYSLVYVFSNEDVKELYGKELKRRFPNRIKFRRKDALRNQGAIILKDIKQWKDQNKHLLIPSFWTCAVNQAFQRILFELSAANKNWISELGKSASNDGGSGEIFVIEILQNLLSESLVQNAELLALLRSAIQADPAGIVEDGRSVSRLFSRLYYTKLENDAPIMTGDICRISSTKFGIIITPECDIAKVVNDESRTFEVLTFSRSSIDEYLSRMNDGFKRSKYDSAKEKAKEKARQRFNNDEARYHLIPSFPFTKSLLNTTAVIDLSSGCERFTRAQIGHKRTHKLNSPFIQQLRQRYLSYLGRVGTPALPPSVRNFNLQVTSGSAQMRKNVK